MAAGGVEFDVDEPVEPVAAAVGAVELGAVGLPEGWAALTHAWSYCDGALALLYAFPPVPPAVLPVFGPCAVVLMPCSLNGAPGELAELPGRFEVCVQSAGVGAAYAGAAAPVMTMPARQLAAKSLRIMITFLSGRAPSRTLYPGKRWRPPSRSKNVRENCLSVHGAKRRADVPNGLAASLIDVMVKSGSTLPATHSARCLPAAGHRPHAPRAQVTIPRANRSPPRNPPTKAIPR